MSRLQGVADTLYIPLTARIYVSKRFPDFFYDEKALSLEKEMPYDQIAAKSSEYFQMAGACRFCHTDRMIRAFIGSHDRCNVINIGCGLETAYFRIRPDEKKAVFYEMNLPEVIASRRRVLGDSENERLIPGDMFDFSWAEGIDKSLPTIITVIGVFQYFERERVTGFLRQARQAFPRAEILFDAMTGKAIRYANSHIKKTGNKNAELHFFVDDPAALGQECGMRLLCQQPFFTQARRQLKKQLSLYTRIAMKVVDEGARRGYILHYALSQPNTKHGV